MPRPDSTPAQYRAQFLLHEIARTYIDGNHALLAMAEACRPSLRCAGDPALRYRIGDVSEAIAAVRFHRRYALVLQSLELSIHGYCVERQFGWERKTEIVFSTRPPPWWRRLLRPAPELVLRIRADGGTACICFEAAGRAAAPERPGYLVRLEPSMQAALAQLHRQHSAARGARLVRLLASGARLLRRNTTASESDM